MEQKQNQIWKWFINAKNGELKTLELINGNMCELDNCDIAVCSAYINDYYPLRGTLIGSLLFEKNINVEQLSKNPEINLQKMGAWLSKETNQSFHRIACLEMIDLDFYDISIKQININVNRSFSTLKFLLEQASFLNIKTETIATSILGTGSQNIELQYILGVMISQFKEILENNPNVKNIKIYEMNSEKVKLAANAINEAINSEIISDVFISYSSKQAIEANKIFNFLKSQNIKCWMAPYSIPTGSNYLDEIPTAITKMKVMILLLTPDSESSPWVQKEVSSAIGANKIVFPYKLYNFNLSPRFTFLLDGEQIFFGNNLSDLDLNYLLFYLQDKGCK